MNLSQEDASLFFNLMWGLQRYVNRQRHILKDIPSSLDYAKLATEKKLKVRDALWKSPELIDAYLEENPESLSPEELDIVRKWKGFIKDRFFILRHLKKYSVFIGNKDNVYGVLGLNQGLEDIVPDYALPIMSEAVLLPFKGRIVYDGLLSSYAISFGGGIRSEFNHTYAVAKEKDRIITTLEPELAPARKAAQKLVTNWMPQLDEMGAAALKLKGDTSLQKATFAFLRASIDLSKCVAGDPDDLTDAYVKGGKAHRALMRVNKILDILDED